MSEKKHINIGTVGHVDHGKTTLTAAITQALADEYKGINKGLQYGQIDKAPEEKARGITIKQTTVEYETPRYHYAHVDCPGHENYVKNMITGASQMDAAILVVSAADGKNVQTEEHVKLCEQVGVKYVFIALNKIDMADPVLTEYVLEEVQALLEKHHFPTNVPVLKVSATKALNGDKEERKKIVEFFNEIENYMPEPQREVDKPFFFPIDGVYAITGRGTVVTGALEKGFIVPGQEVEILGFGTRKKVVATSIETFGRQLPRAQAGDNVGILLRGVSKEDVHKGHVLCAPGKYNTTQHIIMQTYVCREDEKGRKKPFGLGFRPQFFVRTANFTGEVEDISNESKIAMPGDNVTLKVKFDSDVVILEHDKVAIRESNQTICQGTVEQILDSAENRKQ